MVLYKYNTKLFEVLFNFQKCIAFKSYLILKSNIFVQHTLNLKLTNLQLLYRLSPSNRDSNKLRKPKLNANGKISKILVTVLS